MGWDCPNGYFISEKNSKEIQFSLPDDFQVLSDILGDKILITNYLNILQQDWGDYNRLVSLEFDEAKNITSMHIVYRP